MIINPYAFVSRGNDQYTKILVHFDGADGATGITDVCGGAVPHTFTANGNAQLDTGVAPPFGTAYGLFDGSGDYWSTPDSADFAVGSSPFTMDSQVRTGSGNGTRRVLAGTGNGGDPTTAYWFEIDAANKFAAYVGNGTSVTVVQGTTAFASAAWHHVEMCRTGNILKLFVDGVQEGGDQAFSGAVHDSAFDFSIGRLGALASLTMNGGMKEFRLSVGIARHTANFSPPTQPYS